MDRRIFNLRADVNACDCTWGCTDTARESALKVDCEKIPRPTRESSLRRSAACRPDALLTELHPHPFYDIDSVCAHAGFNLDSGATTPTSPCLPFPSLPIFLVAEVPGNKTITTSSSQPLHNSLTGFANSPGFVPDIWEIIVCVRVHLYSPAFTYILKCSWAFKFIFEQKTCTRR